MASEPDKAVPLGDAGKGKDPAQTVATVGEDGDSDPDFDDLDDVLDQFSANAPSTATQKQSTEQAPTATGPGRPTEVTAEAPPIPDGQREGESEEEFMKRLTSELGSAMSQMSGQLPENAEKASPEDLAKMGKELEQFTLAMEKEGIKPEDLLKAILGEQEGSKLAAAAHEEAEKTSPSQSRTTSPTATKPEPSKATASSFEDTIRRTMERMESSSAAATSATQTQSQSEEDMLADLLKSLGTEGGAGSNPDDLSAMFLTMMQQLTNKDMLYEPMKELDQKFPAWLAEKRSTLKTEDVARYDKQQEIVRQIVSKFEERGYSDDDSKSRDYIWEKMQAMQEQGAPPEELIANPFPGMGGLPGMGGGPDEGCPTQ